MMLINDIEIQFQRIQQGGNLSIAFSCVFSGNSSHVKRVIITIYHRTVTCFNPLTAGDVHIRFLHIISTHYNQLLNLFKIKSDINQQDLKFVELHFVKSE